MIFKQSKFNQLKFENIKISDINILLQVPIISVLLFACGPTRNQASADKPYKSIVVDLVSVDSAGVPKFGLVERSFFALQDLDALDGTYAKFKRGGNLTIKEVSGSIVASESFSGGHSPDLRYTLDDGVVVPSDYSSLAMLSAYYQFDFIYAKVNEKLGLDPANLQAKLPEGKHTVLFEPQIKFKLDNLEGEIGIKLNAAFSPKDKQFLLFQRSAIESIPLSSNIQVIAHEFGHSVFDYAFFNGNYEDNNYLGESYAMRGLNEGFADFVSWTYTQSPDILRSSINIEDVANERHITNTTFTWSAFVAQSISGSSTEGASKWSKCSDSFYCIGTIFARSLLEAKTSLPSVTNQQYAFRIIESLRLAQAFMNNLPENIMPKASSTDGEQPSFDFSRQGKFVGGFLYAILNGVEPSWRGPMCQAFAKNFEDEGFPLNVRDQVCP